MYKKFGEFDSYEEINRAAAAQLKEGDLDAIKQIAEENGLDAEDAEDFCTGAIEELTTLVMAAQVLSGRRTGNRGYQSIFKRMAAGHKETPDQGRQEAGQNK